MIRLGFDHSVHGTIVTRVALYRPALDVMTVREVGLAAADDPTVLAWAAGERRVLITRDERTMPRYAYDRVRRSEPMPGVVVIPQSLGLRQAIEDTLILAPCSEEDELENRVRYLPL